jgi:SAM-dependent methyltransferase
MTVDVVDPRGTAVPHPNIRVHPCRVDELDVPNLGPFDAAIALSAVEHFGLGHYDGDEAGRPREDVDAIARARELLRPGGRLVLTVPFGEASEDDFQRVYDDAGLDRLLQGYVEDERRIFTRSGLTEWAERRDGDGPGVALVSATRPA